MKISTEKNEVIYLFRKTSQDMLQVSGDTVQPVEKILGRSSRVTEGRTRLTHVMGLWGDIHE